MKKDIIHEIGNCLHQIIANADYIVSHEKFPEHGEKIKSAAYKIDALLTDNTADKVIFKDEEVSSKSIDFTLFTGLRVLIVDDLEENIFIMENIFKTLSCEIVSTMSGEDALHLYKEGYTPDIVCMDMIMPGIDGVTTTKELKNLGSKAYFIAVSALKNQTHETVAIFDSWLPKPFTIEHVNGALMGYSLKTNQKNKQEQYFIQNDIDKKTQFEIKSLAKNGAYSELKRLIENLNTSKSKEFLQKALYKVNLDAIIKSINVNDK